MKIQPLTKEAFALFGDVVEMDGAQQRSINQGFATRFHDLATINVGAGEAIVSIFKALPRPQPIIIKLMERHPLGSQLFYPLQDAQWYVLVCKDPADETSYQAFKATGHQGINYKPGTWHHPLLVIAESSFIVVDRQGTGNNLEEVWLKKQLSLSF